MPTGVYKRTKKAKENMSKAQSGENHPLFGKHHSQETKEKMRKSALGDKNHNFGKHPSKETRKKLSVANSGENNSNWGGGKSIHSEGYIFILVKNHPNCTHRGYVFEHRLVMEKHLNRYLTKEEVVHHENEIKIDNNLKNLRLFKNQAEHQKYHYKLRKRNIKGRFI